MTDDRPTRASYDCVVVGGGPAGATAAALIAERGHTVLVLERSRFPRHHIGESLMPQTYWTLERLGMLERLAASGFPRKQSVQFVSASGKDSQPYYFTDRDPGAHSITWQVRRDLFDEMMLDNACRRGAEVCFEASVSEVLLAGGRATGVTVRTAGTTRRINASVVVDATGMVGLLSRQLSIREADPELHNACIYAYYDGAVRDEGRNAGATIIIHTQDRKGWFWFIPLSGGVSSIGIVAPPAYLFDGRGGDPAATLDEEIRSCRGVERRLQRARRVDGPYVTSDFSYRSRRLAGDGWVMVGDAYGFLDPIYSSGVFFALTSGEMAADAIHEGLSSGDLSGESLGRFQGRLDGGMHMIRRLVHAFYDRSFSFGRFTRAHPRFQDHIVRLLIGDVFNDEVGEVFDAM
ncbi:MAG: NAD(P)/FAD-dependent oxidoreductase [Phycisphaerae bacterium]